MTDIAAFIEARLSEVQAAANAAAAECPPPWKSYPGKGIVEHSGPESTNTFSYERGIQLWDSEGCTESWRRLCMDETVAAHVALNDPAHVLRQVKAIRRIVESCEYFMWEYSRPDPCASSVLEGVASQWSDHPDFQKEWTEETT